MQTTFGPIEVEPLTGNLGAEIVAGAHIGELDEERLGHLHDAWMAWKVLFFRDQDATVEEHIAFGRQFGELEIHPFLPDNGHPEIVVLDTAGEGPSRAENWHTDVSFREAPPLGSILRGRILPPVGGDTLWADTEAAYDRLPDDVKERIEPLTATHSLRRTFGRRLDRDELDAKLAEFPDQHHPVVRLHPVTGRRSIYVNRPFVTGIDGVEPDEGAHLLGTLLDAVTSPSVQVRFRWRPGSFAMWDNRNTQHYASQDFGTHRRRVERVTLRGDRPFGPVGRGSSVAAPA